MNKSYENDVFLYPEYMLSPWKYSFTSWEIRSGPFDPVNPRDKDLYPKASSDSFWIMIWQILVGQPKL